MKVHDIYEHLRISIRSGEWWRSKKRKLDYAQIANSNRDGTLFNTING